MGAERRSVRDSATPHPHSPVNETFQQSRDDDISEVFRHQYLGNFPPHLGQGYEFQDVTTAAPSRCPTRTFPHSEDPNSRQGPASCQLCNLRPGQVTSQALTSSSEARTLPTALDLPSLLNRDVVSFSHKVSTALCKLSGRVPSTTLLE